MNLVVHLGSSFTHVKRVSCQAWLFTTHKGSSLRVTFAVWLYVFQFFSLKLSKIHTHIYDALVHLSLTVA